MMLERLIEYFKSQPGVTFTTLADYAAQWRAANPLDSWRRSGAIHAQPNQDRGN
jgi:hypothetical protein